MGTRKPIVKDQILSIVAGVSIALLTLFYINFHYVHLEFVLLDVFQNLITIPCMLGLLTVVILGFINWQRSSFNPKAISMLLFLVGLFAMIVLVSSF